MLCFTVGLTSAFRFNKNIQFWIFTNIWLYYLCMAIVIIISFSILCFYKYFQKYPSNYIILGIYTVCHSYLVASICTLYNEESVLISFGCTLGMFIALTFYACVTKTDFTILGGFISSIIMMILIFLILFSFVFSILNLAICCIMIGLLSIFIIWDTQMIIGGKHKAQMLSLDDYCIAAIIIYSDIISLFL